ncbi:MAG: NAD(P)/FAD-dependent oxidoreductase [Actinomycetota bacterium]|nr:NAD(P)/FAD-dependent oxidoreductase [Actinomycetota bacterium]
MNRPQVLIVGAGFAGLNAAKALKRAPVSITIIDRRNFHLFQPLLYQVAAAALNPSDIAYPIRSVFRRQENVERVLLAEVVDVDLVTKKVQLDDGQKVEFDYLILATGARHSYFGNDEWESLAPGLKTVEDALLMRRRVLEAFEQAEKNPGLSAMWLTFVVVGAGPTGVELAGALIEIAVHALGSDFDEIDPTKSRVVLVEGADRVLPPYVPSLSASARSQLESLGVEVITGVIVEAIDSGGVVLSSGKKIESGTVLWAAGVEASPLGAMLGVGTDRTGRVPVEADLSVLGHSEVFVAGDLAGVDGVPGVAPAAMQMGRHAAKVITAELAGRRRPPFRYSDKGSLATIGRARAVADIRGLRFSGFLAWFAWLAIHIFYLIGFRNRLFVIAGWAWSYLTFKRGARIITGVPGDGSG